MSKKSKASKAKSSRKKNISKDKKRRGGDKATKDRATSKASSSQNLEELRNTANSAFPETSPGVENSERGEPEKKARPLSRAAAVKRKPEQIRNDPVLEESADFEEDSVINLIERLKAYESRR